MRMHVKLNHLSIQDRKALKVTHRMSSWTFADSPALVSARNIVPRDLHIEFWVTVCPWVYWLQSRKAVLTSHSASVLLTQFTLVNSEWVSEWSRMNCFWETCLDKITSSYPFVSLKASLDTQLLRWILSGQQLFHFFSCHNDVLRNQLKDKETAIINKIKIFCFLLMHAKFSHLFF